MNTTAERKPLPLPGRHDKVCCIPATRALRGRGHGGVLRALTVR
jgi:hypothetical protein